MHGSAHTLRRDVDAARNTLAEGWSDGQTKGQINRLKTLRRAIYGRASTEVLRARMLPLHLPIQHGKLGGRAAAAASAAALWSHVLRTQFGSGHKNGVDQVARHVDLAHDQASLPSPRVTMNISETSLAVDFDAVTTASSFA